MRRSSPAARQLPALVGFAIVLSLTLVTLAALLRLGTFSLRDELPPTVPGMGTRVADLGASHIPDDARGQYNTTPPTSGPHWNAPAPWGLSDVPLPDERTTHNLEHGGVVISFRELPGADHLALTRQVTDLRASGRDKLLLQPHKSIPPGSIALTAWRWILILPRYDPALVQRFIDAHYLGPDAPEPRAP